MRLHLRRAAWIGLVLTAAGLLAGAGLCAAAPPSSSREEFPGADGALLIVISLVVGLVSVCLMIFAFTRSRDKDEQD
jgi:heme/copper-type cytochrome/quinol oxidase subunit 2